MLYKYNNNIIGFNLEHNFTHHLLHYPFSRSSANDRIFQLCQQDSRWFGGQVRSWRRISWKPVKRKVYDIVLTFEFSPKYVP